MSKKFNDAPVPELKIQMIENLLKSQPVNDLWCEFIRLGNHGGTPKQREEMFQRYAKARDEFLGLKPVVLQGIVSEHRKKLL